MLTHRSRRLAATLCAGALLLAGCGQVPAAAPEASGALGTSGAPGASGAPEASRGTCPTADAAAPEGPSARLVVLSEGEGSAPRVEGVVYPRPDHTGRPWSQWGQGIVLDDGRVVSAMGDHAGVDGNSYLFVLDPDRGVLTRFADVLSQVPHQGGEFGYGKIHAQLVEASCQVIVATYWGTRTGLAYGGSYTGDWLLALDPATLEIEPLGVPVAGHGIPSLAAHDGLVYGEAVDPRGRAPGEAGDVGAFFVYDVERREVTQRIDDTRHLGFRALAVDADGRAFLAMADGGLLRYDPPGDSPGGALVVHEGKLPGGGWLRAATAPAPDGTVYAVTTAPDRYVALQPDGTVADLGPASGYIASVALAPDAGEFYAVPGAHGGAESGRLIAVDTRTGAERLVVDLRPLVQQGLGLTIAGSYNVAMDAERGLVHVGLNAGPTADNAWGEVVAVVVEP